MLPRTKAQTPLGERWAAAAGRTMGRWATWAALHAAKRELAALAALEAIPAPQAVMPAPHRSSGMLAVASELVNVTAQLGALRAAEALSIGSHRKAAELAAMRAELSQLEGILTRTPGSPHPPSSPGMATRQAALAEARAELADLLTPSRRRPSPPKQRESLSTLRAELAYLESLGRKPNVYGLPPGDAERDVQLQGVYAYTAAAFEPRIADFYVAPSGPARAHTKALTPPASSRVAVKASELSVLREQLAELEVQRLPEAEPSAAWQSPHLHAAAAATGRDAYSSRSSQVWAGTPGAEMYSNISFGDGASALHTPPVTAAWSDRARTPDSLKSRALAEELAAARAELTVLHGHLAQRV